MKKDIKNSSPVTCKMYNEGEGLTPIICIGGSEGGIPCWWSKLISQQVQNPVCALGYFACQNQPPHLQNIDVDYFKKTVLWLLEKYDTKKVILIGNSRGGELVLLLGSLFPSLFSGIIATAPSSVLHGGIPLCNQPAWIHNNNSIPFLGGLTPNLSLTEKDDINNNIFSKIIAFHQNTENDPWLIADNFRARKQHNSQRYQKAVIPVENITCPILLFSGDQDAIWPASSYCREIINRLNANQSTVERTHIDYKQVGHGLLASYDLPIWHSFGEFWCKLGGTPEFNKKANLDCLQQIVAFLKKNSENLKSISHNNETQLI